MDDPPHPEFRRLAHALGDILPRADIPLTIGDDGAHIIPPSKGLIAVADMMVEGTHFRRRYTPMDALGHKILAVNLSDIAAMGATPRYALLTLGVPTDLHDDDVAAIFRGLRRLGERHGVSLVGGDLTAAPEGALVASLTCLGSPGPKGPITRRGAEVGDAIAVIGSLGGARSALMRLEGGEDPSLGSEDKSGQGALHPWSHPLLYPAPQVQAGIALGEIGAHAMMDLSDGLHSDIQHILARGVLGARPQLGANINLNALPLSPGLGALPREEALGHALYGGEDYALLVIAPPSGMLPLVTSLGASVIGEITPEPGLTFRGEAPPPGQAWAHFPRTPHG